MGCWNKTCGLTNLPIMCGEKTYVFVLERVQEIHDHCYATHLYRPLLLPFTSTYNDYGAGEDSEGAALPLIMDGIKQRLIEMPLGENKYHDIAVTKDEWGEDLFFESVHENRLRIKKHAGECEVSFVMMRKDVVDELIDSYEFEEYVGAGKGTHGWSNAYVRYRLSDVINDIDPFFDAILRIKEETTWAYPRMDMVSFRYLDGQDTKNRAAQWVQHESGYRYSGIVMIREHIMDLLAEGKRDLARELMVDHFKGMFVDIFMEMTRKSWIPGCQEGSQSQDYRPYRALMASMNKVMDERDAEYADDDCEDEVSEQSA